MYHSFYNLKAKPFKIATDQEFSWFGKHHSEVLSAMKDSVHNENGFFLLFGKTGSGKTTFINDLVKILEANFIIAKFHNPDFERIEFFRFLSERFQINKKFTSKGAFFVHFNFFLKNAYSANKRLIIIVDEAHRLNKDLLKELSVLSDIEINNKKMVNIILAGQEGLNALIEQQDLSWITEKVTYKNGLRPLNEQETNEYIKYHLISAGQKRKIFTSGAIREIYSFSKGNPALINIICDSALLTGYSNGVKEINSAIIRKCADEFQVRKSMTDKNVKKDSASKKKSGTLSLLKMYHLSGTLPWLLFFFL